MEKRYVFCGCQYPSRSGGNKSAWEWDLPTPKKKRKVISQSNPTLHNQRTVDMESFNKRYSDHLYEPVNPPPLYDRSYMGTDPETSSLDDHHMFEIPPELDIVTSEGLDGLDEPDPHDFGIDGDREWRLSPEPEQSSSTKAVFTAGIRKEIPKLGETSSKRPLSEKFHQLSAVSTPEIDQEVRDEPPLELDDEISGSMTPVSRKSGSFRQLKSQAENMKKRLGKISLSVKPNLNNWSGMKIFRKKPTESTTTLEKEEDFEPQVQQNVQVVPDIENQIIQKLPPSPILAHDPEVKQLKIHFDETIDLTLRAPTPTTPKSPKKGRESPNVHFSPIEDEIISSEVELAKKAQEEELVRLREEEKLQKLKIQEEAKLLKLEEKLQREKVQEELKLAKAAEKAGKEREKEEQKRLKTEEKLLKQKEEEELKKQKQIEQEAAKKRKQQEELELKLQKEAEHDEQIRQKEFEMEKLHKQKQEAEKQKLVQSIAKPSTTFEADMIPTTEFRHQNTSTNDSEVTQSEVPVSKKVSKVEQIKRKIGDIEFKKRFKRSKTPPQKSTPPKFKFTRGPQNELALQYRREIEQRMQDMEEEEDAQVHTVKQCEPTQIYVTHPSIEFESETHVEWIPPRNSLEEGKDDDAEMEDVATTKKEKKLSKKIKGFGVKSKALAAKTSKDFGQQMKVIGQDLKQLPGKVNIKYHEAIKEMRAQEEARRLAIEEKQKEKEDAGSCPTTPAGKVFRFKRRSKKNQDVELDDDDTDEKPVETNKRKPLAARQPVLVEPIEHKTFPKIVGSEPKIQRNVILGEADRDWESPQDLISDSREVSEDRNLSTGGSSVASSSIHGRRQGVLEEIDSDEFFLREKGISEGEDEEEMNRFLVSELRQAFRPTHINVLANFDVDPPVPPIRSSRKQNKVDRASNFQTFPPERPKRKQIPGYISSYMNQNGENSRDLRGINEKFEFGAEQIEVEDEGIARVKAELRKITLDLEREDERYEPVNGSAQPQRPRRSKKQKKGKKLTPIRASPPRILYYNTIAANEWVDSLEDQITQNDKDGQNEQARVEEPMPKPPKRNRKKSGTKNEPKSNNFGQSETNLNVEESEFQFADEDEEAEFIDNTLNLPPLAPAESAEQFEDIDELLDLMDGGGYAQITKKTPELPPSTVPRRKKRGGKTSAIYNKATSLKRKSREGPPSFFSLPRFTPRTFHIIPPSRPHRTYSTLRPKRPPRRTSKIDKPLKKEHNADPVEIINSNTAIIQIQNPTVQENRPSSQIMRGRPLPPPPRPPRSPQPMNDLDQEVVERMLGVRHYANFNDVELDSWGGIERKIGEEVCISKNIPLVGEYEEEDEIDEIGDVNVGIQTDPLTEEDFDYNSGSFEEDEERFQILRDSINQLPSDELEHELDIEEEKVPVELCSAEATAPKSPTPVPTVVFPTRLHLSELEVDFLRVNELSAQILTMDHIHTSHLQVNALSSASPLSVTTIQSSTLSTESLNAGRLSSNSNDFPIPSIPPQSFFNLASPQVDFPLDPPVDNLLSSSIPDTQGVRIPTSRPSPISKNIPHSEENLQVFPNSSQAREQAVENDDTLDLAMRLGRSLLRSGMRAIESMSEYFESLTPNDPESEQKQKTHLQIMICLLLLLVTGIFLMTRTTSPPQRWEFYLPPSNL